MFPLPEMIIAVLAPFAGLFSAFVWGPAQERRLICQGSLTRQRSEVYDNSLLD